MILANKYGLNIVPRGAATCHTSGCKPNQKSIVVHLSLMDKIIEINKEDLTAKVQPYVVVKQLQEAAEKQDYFSPDPSNLAVSTVGGAAALCAGGPRAFKYGTTKRLCNKLKSCFRNR